MMMMMMLVVMIWTDWWWSWWWVSEWAGQMIKPGEPWLDDTSPNTDPQADLQKERGAHGFQNEAGNTFRTNNENSIHVRQKIPDSGPQSDKCSPPISSTNRWKSANKNIWSYPAPRIPLLVPPSDTHYRLSWSWRFWQWWWTRRRARWKRGLDMDMELMVICLKDKVKQAQNRSKKATSFKSGPNGLLDF